MSAAAMAFGAFLQSRVGRRSPVRGRLALLLSAIAHGAVVVAAVLVPAAPTSRPAPTPEPIRLRLPRLGRPPAPSPAPPPRPLPRPRRRPPAALVQPPETPLPPPVDPPPLPPPLPPPVAAEPEPPEDSTEDAPEQPAGPPSPPAAFGVVADDGPRELRDVARAPAALEQVKPEYPREARWERLEGLVIVRVVIGTDGRVERSRTRVVRSIPALDAAAVAAIERWRFSPAIDHTGRPVRVVIDVPVRFSLR